MLTVNAIQAVIAGYFQTDEDPLYLRKIAEAVHAAGHVQRDVHDIEGQIAELERDKANRQYLCPHPVAKGECPVCFKELGDAQ